MFKTQGALFLISGLILLLGILIAEIFYQGSYSISKNMISNLGSTPPPNSLVYEPSARIFDLSLIIAGTLTALGGLALRNKVKKEKYIWLGFLIMGVATAGVGIFPAYHIIPHSVCALIAFTAGGVTAVLGARMAKSPFSLISTFLGSISLAFLVIGLWLPDVIVPFLGRGGVERLIAYPVIIWLVAFGSYLLG